MIMTLQATLECGTVVKVGDWVGFKSDWEQSGKILAISKSGTQLKLGNESGFEGHYINGDTVHYEDTDRCWAD